MLSAGLYPGNKYSFLSSLKVQVSVGCWPLVCPYILCDSILLFLTFFCTWWNKKEYFHVFTFCHHGHYSLTFWLKELMTNMFPISSIIALCIIGIASWSAQNFSSTVWRLFGKNMERSSFSCQYTTYRTVKPKSNSLFKEDPFSSKISSHFISLCLNYGT